MPVEEAAPLYFLEHHTSPILSLTMYYGLKTIGRYFHCCGRESLMQINFNDLRKKLIKDYNIVVECLNSAVCIDSDMNRIIQPVDEIKMKLERLRFDIIAIGMLEDPNLPDCSCVINDSNDIKEFVTNP